MTEANGDNERHESSQVIERSTHQVERLSWIRDELLRLQDVYINVLTLSLMAVGMKYGVLPSNYLQRYLIQKLSK